MQFKQAGHSILTKLKKELPKTLCYHSAGHTMDVYQAAERIGLDEGIAKKEMKLVLTAALYHDSGFLKSSKDHECESCRIAESTLPLYGYKPMDIDAICGMIMSTKIPQDPKNHLEEILADADLDYLGREDFFTTGEKLFKELAFLNIANTRDEWNQIQVRFLENHHYFTQTSINSRQAKKEKHLQQLKERFNYNDYNRL